MKTVASLCLSVGGLAILGLFAEASLQPVGLAQQLVEKDTGMSANCPTIGTSPGTNEMETPCGIQSLAALSGPNSATKPNSSSNLDSNPYPNQRMVDPALVLGTGRTLRDARKYFEKSARRGNGAAQVNLAMLYVHGWGVAQNYGTALYWLKSAADREDSRAYANLGILYLKGWGVRQDYGEALGYFHRAADRGNTPALIDLGYMNDSGLGTPVDHAAAAEWYRKAAERGDALGQNNLADLYLRGEGVPQNDALAFAWFQKAAEQGNTGARIKLGFLYANGRASSKDAEAAYAWIMAASLAGDHRGEGYLAALEAQLTSGQLARARQRAQELQVVRDLSPGEIVLVR